MSILADEYVKFYKEVLSGIIGVFGGNLVKQVFQILIDPVIIGLGRFDQAVKDGVCSCPVDRVDIDLKLSNMKQCSPFDKINMVKLLLCAHERTSFG